MAFKKGIGGINKLGTEGSEPAGTAPKGMVALTVHVPVALRDAMREIWQTKGYTMSQQARMSLTLWLKAHAKDPSRIDGLFAMSISPRSVQAAVEAELSPEQRKQREVQKQQNREARAEVQRGSRPKWDIRERQMYNAGHDPNYDYDKDLEPDTTLNEHGRHSEEWIAWNNRRMDYTIARLAEGKFKVPAPKPAHATLPDWLAPHVPAKPEPEP